MNRNKKKSSGLEKIQHLLSKDISFRSGMSDKRKEGFYRELRLLIEAGLDVKSALELYKKEAPLKEQKIYHDIDHHLLNGKSLSKSMELTGQFSPYELFSIQIGEETGKLKEVLEQVAAFYSRKIKLQRQFIGVFTYPAFVMAVAMGVVYFMLSSIVPMFADIFKRFNGELPKITLIILRISDFTRSYAGYFFLLLLAAGVYIYTQRREVWFRRSFSKVVLNMPVLGTTVRKIYMARFCQAMHLLTSSKVPLTEAVKLVRMMIGFYPIETSLSKVATRLVNGVSLNKALLEHPVYEKRMVALIKVAEEVNQLDNMFNQLAKQYNEDVEHQTKVLGSVLEPLMILIIALFVGVILISMYLPLFKLSTTVG